MDTLTHALSGALAARAIEPDPSALPRRTRLWVGFWAAAFPDSDFILRLIDPLTYLTMHRGWTHSLVLLPLWALGLAFAFYRIYRGKYSVRSFFGVCALGIGIHILGDVITAFGTMVFSPLSDARVAFPFTFIIDPYFSAIIVAGLIGAARWQSRNIALAALVTLTGYVGLQGVLHRQAQRVGESHAASAGLESAVVHALPQPLSPFHWMIVVTTADSYDSAYVSLWGASAPAAPADSWLRRTYAAYRPRDQAQWTRVPRFGQSAADAAMAQELWNSSVFADYRHFTLLPVLYRVDRTPAGECVWFQDLRFASPGRDMPFRYGACRENGAWRMYQLVDDRPRPVTTAQRAD